MRIGPLACAAAFVFALEGGAAAAWAQQPPSPADLPAQFRGGEIDNALQAQDWPRAEGLLVAAIEREPESPDLLKVLGSVFLIQRKPLNAAIAYKKAEALAPLEPASRFALVLAYVAMNRGDWARPELDRLLGADPSNATYEYWLARLDYDDGLYASAVARLERVVRVEPTSVRAYDNLGLNYEALNEPDRAIAAYRKAVEINRTAVPPSPWPALNLGILLRQQGALADAEALLREAVSHDDGLAQAHYQLGVVLEQTGREEEAAAALLRASERDAAYAAPHYALARVYRRLGRAADAQLAMATFERLHRAEREAGER